MAQKGINYFFTGALGLNQNSLKIFYDFNSGDSNHILSVPIGNAEHSGEIFGNTGDFFGNMGSGNFQGKSVKIANSTGIFSKNATFIVTQEKTGIGNGTIFSNLQGTGYSSGYAFGVNDANKFYFEYKKDQDPIIKTSLKNLSDKNAWAVKLEENSVSFCYYNNNTCQLEKSSWAIDSSKLLESDQWYLGTGIGKNPYNNYLDNFIYINQSISDSNLTRLFSGIWNEKIESQSGYLPYETGQITGQTYVPTGITGILGITQEFSGYSTGTGSREIYTYDLLTGSLSSGETYLTFLSNLPQFCTNREEKPVYFENLATGSMTGITGLELNLSGVEVVNEVYPVYQEVYTTGFISTGSVLTNLYNTGNAADIIYLDTSYLSGDIPYLNSFGMKSVSYLGAENSGYFESLAMTGNPFKNYFNKIASYNFGSLNFTLDGFYNSGFVDVFANGYIQSTGGYQITGEFFNQGVEIFGDYYISGKGLNFDDPYGISDQILYDILNSGTKYYTGRSEQVVSGSEPVVYNGESVFFAAPITYSPSGTLDIPVEGNLFFFSGLKLVSGVDYSGVSGLFAPTERIRSGVAELKTLPIREFQFYLNNVLQANKINFSFSSDFISGTTGVDAEYEILSGFYDGNPFTADIFNGASVSYILESGVYGTGFYNSPTGFADFPAYTGWQIYSGSDVFDVNFNIYPSPPLTGWENGTELLLGWQPSGLVTQMTGETFLRDTSLSWVNGVRISRSKFIEHGLNSDLLIGNQSSITGLSGLFSNNTDFWE